jgi:pimeloyl-ACP methyl ester carboxylesterase
LILHGLFGSSGNWRSVARALSASHRVISVDLRNHGNSPWAETMSYLEMADDVRALIEWERLHLPIVMGHSMGGKTAMTLALLYPELLSRLIVVDIAPVCYADRLSMITEAMRSVDTMAAASRDEVQQRLGDLLPDASAVPFLMQNLVARNARFDWRVNLASIGAESRRLSGFPAELRGLRFTKPVQVIAGQESDYVTDRDGAEFRPMFPEVQLEVIERAGHWVHADQRGPFLDVMTRALRVRPSSAPCGAAAAA